MYYKGYKIGSVEKEVLKLILNIKEKELPSHYNESFSDIFKTARQKSEYSNTIKRMVKKGILIFLNKDREVFVVLTKIGKITAEFIFQNYYKKIKPKIWDEKWRLVMFDIPEKRKKIRNLLRFHLKKIGFIQVQGSVWVYPYPCEEIIVIIKIYFNLNDEVLYFTTDHIENDQKLRKIFKLKK